MLAVVVWMDERWDNNEDDEKVLVAGALLEARAWQLLHSEAEGGGDDQLLSLP